MVNKLLGIVFLVFIMGQEIYCSYNTSSQGNNENENDAPVVTAEEFYPSNFFEVLNGKAQLLLTKKDIQFLQQDLIATLKDINSIEILFGVEVYIVSLEKKIEQWWETNVRNKSVADEKLNAFILTKYEVMKLREKLRHWKCYVIEVRGNLNVKKVHSYKGQLNIKPTALMNDLNEQKAKKLSEQSMSKVFPLLFGDENYQDLTFEEVKEKALKEKKERDDIEPPCKWLIKEESTSLVARSVGVAGAVATIATCNTNLPASWRSLPCSVTVNLGNLDSIFFNFSRFRNSRRVLFCSNSRFIISSSDDCFSSYPTTPAHTPAHTPAITLIDTLSPTSTPPPPPSAFSSNTTNTTLLSRASSVHTTSTTSLVTNASSSSNTNTSIQSASISQRLSNNKGRIAIVVGVVVGLYGIKVLYHYVYGASNNDGAKK